MDKDKIMTFSSYRTPKIFVSSVLKGLEEIRQQIHDWAENNGYNAWISEKEIIQPELKSTKAPELEKVCIDNVDDSDLYIAIFHRGYGSSAEKHFANISFVDLELFEAFKQGKPIKYYVLEPFDPESELQALFKIVRKLLPDSLTVCQTKGELLETIKRDIDKHFKRKNTILWNKKAFSNFKYFVSSCILNRKKYDDEEGGIKFLADKYPKPTCSFDKEQLKLKILEINNTKSYQERLNKAWDAFNILFNVPWQQKEHHEHLKLWDQFLGIWDTAAAWYGLHGFTYVGKLAGDNTLVAIRALIASHGETSNLKNLIRSSADKTGCRKEWVDLYSLGGALASEYYSIAQIVPLRRIKEHYLHKADSWIDVAEKTYKMEENKRRQAGLSSIRGHIYLELGKIEEAIKLLELSLKLRQDYGLSPVSIAEAKADLGHAYVRLGNKREAEKLLVEGVYNLEKAMVPGFTARAKRKLAKFYFERGDLKKCVNQLIEAEAICKKYGIKDQFNKLVVLSCISLKLIAKLWHNSGPLEVIETENGYQYIKKT